MRKSGPAAPPSGSVPALPAGRRTVDPAGLRITAPAVLACFYLAGGALTLLALAVPGWNSLDRTGVLLVGLAAVASGGAVLVLRDQLSTAGQHVLVALGSVLVGAAMMSGGGSSATFAFASYFTFVAVYAALFFRPPGALVQLAWAGVVHAAALVNVGASGAAPSTLVVFGSVGGTALVVTSLVRQMRRLAATDPLTGLLNRRSFDEQLAQALARAERSQAPVGLLALDLDGFKAVNDRFGHAAGDRLLVQVGVVWSEALRRGDLLARAGGDEFLVLLPDADDHTARRVASRLAGSTPHPVGVSIGVVVAEPGESADDLLRRADAELYRHKARR